MHSVCVWIVEESFLRDAATAHPKAANPLAIWIARLRAPVGDAVPTRTGVPIAAEGSRGEYD